MLLIVVFPAFDHGILMVEKAGSRSLPILSHWIAFEAEVIIAAIRHLVRVIFILAFGLFSSPPVKRRWLRIFHGTMKSFFYLFVRCILIPVEGWCI